MENTMTPATGNGTVQEAASQFFDMMEEAENPEGQNEAEQESDEIEEGESDEEELEASEELDSEDEDEEQESEPTYRIKMAGEEREITQRELIKLAQQGADYTKKSQQVSEQRKALDAEAAAINEAKQLRNEYAQRLEAMQQMLKAQQPEDDLDYLQENDPIGYAVKVADMTRREKQMQAIEYERQRIAQQQHAEQSEHQRRQVAAEAEKVTELIPDYSDAKKGAALRQELRAYAKSIGYTDAEIGAVYDARTVKALYDAMQYQKLVESKPGVSKKVQSAPKMIKSGTSTNKTSTTEAQRRQFNKLKSTGRVKDAASLFEKFI
jgi:hypothetical protein